jgi:lysophospholipase L1-like esterase
MGLKIKDGQTVVCIGDSITDCGRRDQFAPLGNGYVKLFSDLLAVSFPKRKINIINKGIGGNTILDLQQRWEDDVMYHKPDWLTVLIGINDLHRVLSKAPASDQLTVKKYEQRYQELLSRTKKRLRCGVVLLEPFYVSLAKTDTLWRSQVLSELRKYDRVVRLMSRKFHTGLVKLQDIFEEQLKYRDSETFCPEPVHPNLTGHLVIAQNLFQMFLK